MPGLLALMIFRASTVFCWSAGVSYGVPSMSMSIALSPYALMTFWYAAATAAPAPRGGGGGRVGPRPGPPPPAERDPAGPPVRRDGVDRGLVLAAGERA